MPARKAAAPKQFNNPLANCLPAYQEVLEATKRMTREEIDADWDAKQRQRADSGMDMRVPTLNLISRVTGQVVRIPGD